MRVAQVSCWPELDPRGGGDHDARNASADGCRRLGRLTHAPFAMDGGMMPQAPQELPPVSLSPDTVGVLPIFRELSPQPAPAPPDIHVLHDVELDVKIELGRVRMRIEDVLNLADGSVVELDRLAGDPVDV